MKKLIAIVLSSLLLIGAAVGGTLALASDEERSANVYTAGNINIELVNGQVEPLELFPAVYNFGIAEPWAVGTNGLWTNIRNAHTKNIAVKNIGKNDAYVRVIIAYENPELADGGNFYDLLKLNKISDTLVDEKVVAGRIEIDGVDYKIVSYTFKSAIAAGTTSEVVLSQLALKTETTSEQLAAIGDNFNLLICAQAVQVDGTNGPEAMLNAAFPNEHPWVDFAPGTLVQTASQLQTALEKGGKITVVGDIKLTEALTIPEGKTVTLDLNGKTISANHHKSNGAVLKNEGTLVLTGGTIKSTGNNGGSAIQNSGTLTAHGVTLNGAPNADGSWPSYTVNNTGVMTVNNSKITSYHGAVASYNSGALVTLNNTEIDMAGIPGFTSHGIYTYDNGKVIVNSGIFANKATDQNASGASVINGNVTVYGGTFSGRIENYNGTPAIYGGTFSVKPSAAFVATGYEVTENADGTYTVSMSSDLIDSSDKLIAAIKNAADGTKLLVAPGNYNLHFTNHTTFNVDNLTIVGVAGENPVTFTITSSEVWYGRIQGNNVTFENINFVNVNGSVGATGKATYNNCTFAGILELASSGGAETYVNNCKMDNIHTSTEMNAGAAYVKGSTMVLAEYNARAAMNFENCAIGTLLSHGGNTVLTNCKVDSIVIKGGTVIIDGKYFANSATSLQAALNAATGDAEIVLGADITGDVTVTQKANVKITIDGKGHQFAGVLLVDGKSATIMTAGLTIQDVVFKADSISADACVQLGKDNNTRYTCNVTLSGCTFDVPGAVGVKSYTGGDKNLTISGCTATANAHSLVQAKGIDGVLVEDCTLYSKNGMNFNNSDNVTVSGCTADVKGYAVRFGEGTANTGNAETYLIENCSLKSACDDGDAVIVLRGTADNSTLTLKNNTIEGTAKIANTTTNATVVEVND